MLNGGYLHAELVQIMDIRGWLQQWLGIDDIHEKVLELDNRIGSIEICISSMLQDFNEYRTRTDQELLLMRSQLEKMLSTVSNLIDAAENSTDSQRAMRLRSRLRNNLTRVNNVYLNRVSQ